jgi:hypothetical protein
MLSTVAGVQVPPPTRKEKREKAVQKSVTGDVSSGILNQARLRPLIRAFSGVYQPWRLLFKFSEKADAVLVHCVFEAFLDELLRFLACFYFI